MKKIPAAFFMIVTVMYLFAGCGKPPPTEFHIWNSRIYGRETIMVYDVKGDSTERIGDSDGYLFVWDINNIELDFSFGPDSESSYYGSDANGQLGTRPLIEGYELHCFAAYFYWYSQEKSQYSNDNPVSYHDIDFFDDYRAVEYFYFLTEISPEDFLSEQYSAKYGKTSFLNTEAPVMSHHERFSLPPEVLQYDSGTFYFGITAVYYSQEKQDYNFGVPNFGSDLDGIGIGYKHLENNKIGLFAGY